MDQSHLRGSVREDTARTFGGEDGELTTSVRNLLVSDSTTSITSRFLKLNSIGEDASSTTLPGGTWIRSWDPIEHHLAAELGVPVVPEHIGEAKANWLWRDGRVHVVRA